MAADLGLQVTLVDLDANPGGVCLYRGCIPSKAFLHVAKVLTEAREASAFGVDFQPPKIDLKKMRQWKDGVIRKMTGGLGQLSKSRKIDYIQGRASFLDSRYLKIERTDGGETTLSYKWAILSTGSRPATIPAFSLDSPRLLDSTGALECKDIPKTLLVVGGGYIGLELGTVYAALGTEVSVVEMTPGLLPGADRDLVDVLAKRAHDIFETVMLETRVTGMAKKDKTIQVTMETREGKSLDRAYEKVLVSIGRKPNSGGLGLENTKVGVDEKGFVIVDRQQRTSDPSILAIGDVAGEPMLAHKASHEGRVAAEVIAGQKSFFDAQAIPAVVFTDPELAWCGLTEAEAAAENREVRVTRFPWAASGRATTLGRNDGLTKMIIDPKSERVLGVGIVGPGAGELIAEATLAIEMGAVASDMSLTIHPHPTLSETVMESAELFFGHCTHLYAPKKK